jgi:hypothetical protein
LPDANFTPETAMRRTPTVRRLCLLLAAGWLAVGAPPASAAAIAQVGIAGAGSAAAQPGVSTPASARNPSSPLGFGDAAHLVLDEQDQPDPQLLAAAGSLSQGYLTPVAFSWAQSNDTNASRLHLPRHDPDLEAIDSHASSRYPSRADDGINPAWLWLSGLGLVTAAISGVLQYARNPITRKRKYRNYDRAPS